MSEIDAAVLEKFQTEMDAYNQKVEKIDLELAAKRNEMMLPLYEQRREIIAKIPNFWLTVFRNHMGLSQIIEEEDIPALEHLTDVWVKHDPKEIRSFEIVFTFSDNEYFSNKELIKKVTYKDDEQVAESFTINWKDGKDLTKSKRKQGADSDMSDSFFSYFKDDDVTIAHFIANELFPDALSSFVNGDDDDEEFDDESEGSIELSDEEEDEEEEEEPSKKKNKK